MEIMFALSWIGIMLLVGTLLRAKLKCFQDFLVPASVVGGIIGFLLINISELSHFEIGTNVEAYSQITNYLFTVSFISISLTGTKRDEKNIGSNIRNGAIGMGVVWCLLYALTPAIGMIIIQLAGKEFGMDKMYGSLIPFAFAQGPGQAASFGKLYEDYGWENAQTVAVTFSVIGFLVAFLVGIPAAKKGIKIGLASHCGEIDNRLAKGYLKKEEQNTYMVKDTTCSSNIETISFHFALIGLCFIMAVGISKVFALLPGFLGSSMSGLLFMNGMYAAYIVKFIMKKLKIEYLIENTLQNKITGWTTDFLVVSAFMSISINVIEGWLVPIVIECIVISILTAAICFWFGARFGGNNDFERTLGLFGTCTGTVPSGIALIRIVDPEQKTSTAIELGMMNLVMQLCTPVYFILLANASGSLNTSLSIVLLLTCSILYLVILKITKCWKKKPSYSWGKNICGNDKNTVKI